MSATKNRGWIAVVLSVLFPGLGQLYYGNRLKAFITWLVLLALPLAAAWTGLFDTFTGLIISMVLIVVISLASIADAFYSAVKARPAPRPRLRAVYFLLLLPLLAADAYGMTTSSGREHLLGAASYFVPVESMATTIARGERFMADLKRYNGPMSLRGQVIIYKHDQRTFVKRVVAIEHDVVELRNHQLVLNGQLVEEPYAILSHTASASEHAPANVGPITVPAGHVYVLGDNRNNSQDSRTFGPVAVEKIRGTAAYIYWSHDRSRIGQRIE